MQYIRTRYYILVARDKTPRSKFRKRWITLVCRLLPQAFIYTACRLISTSFSPIIFYFLAPTVFCGCFFVLSRISQEKFVKQTTKAVQNLHSDTALWLIFHLQFFYCFLHRLVGLRLLRLCPFLVSEVEQEIYSARDSVPRPCNGFHPLTLTRGVSLDLLLASLGGPFTLHWLFNQITQTVPLPYLYNTPPVPPTLLYIFRLWR